MTLVSLVEYAKAHNKTDSAARRMALRGGFKTAQKIGRNWIIDRDEPWPDKRVKSGQYVNQRKQCKSSASQHI